MKTDLPRTLGLLDALSIVIGVVIGGGIFLVPNLIAQNLPSAPWILAIWIFAGVVSFFGGLACAELGAAMPATGGQYVYLREAFGPMAGFLCGWTNFLISRGAQSAWLAVVLAIYISYFHPFGPIASKAIAVAAIAVFTYVNYRGVSLGALVQKSFTSAKLVGIFVIVGSAFLFGHASVAPAAPVAPVTPSSFGVALIACLLAYDGWVQMSFVAGEMKNPQRNILLALGFGIAAVVTVYLLANLAYLRVLSIPEIAASTHVGADAAGRVLGPVGGTLVSVIILLSIVGSLNGAILTCPRVYFAQARDGLFFRRFGEVHPRYRTPGFAILAQGVWAAILIISGSYETLIDYAMFAIWLSYVFMIASVLVLRRTQSDLPRPYRMWGYPVTPFLFLGIALWFLGNMVVTRPIPSLAALGLIAAGVPVYFVWRRVAMAPDTHEKLPVSETDPT
ncbi:MAG TPA: amino acid permease [Bryobacteraceae bacterium]|nr:amino acid permease [Bryobacteraceae bacterium]